MDDYLLRFTIIQITDYVFARPDSADTVEGIHQWWIQWPGTAESMAVTLTALAQLEQSGVMQSLRVGNREVWRRRRPERLIE